MSHEMSRDWSLLFPDIVFSISKKITYIVDYIRFRAVCTNWRSTLSPIPRHLPTQIPWLMIPFNPDDQGKPNEDFLVSFYNPVESKVHELNLPELRGHKIYGASYGWFILEKDGDVSLLNPVTRERVSLPSLIDHVDRLTFGPESESNCNPKNGFLKQHKNKLFCIEKACLSCQPSLGSECIVSFIMYTDNWEVAFCRVGDQCWTQLDVMKDRNNDEFVNINYHGLLHCNNYSGDMTLIDVQNPWRKLVTSPDPYDKFCLVEGELQLPFLVARNVSHSCLFESLDEICPPHNGLDYNHVLLEDKMLFFDSRFRCIGVSCDKLQLDGWTGKYVWFVTRELSQQPGEWWSCSIKSFPLNHRADEKVVERNLGSFRWYWQYLWITPSLF